MDQALKAHLETGDTTVCRAWALRRRDGVELGFTDHDRDLSFDGIVFRADTGLSAKVLSQSSGLSVDNSSAAGVLSAEAIREEDIDAGRYDGAEVRAWLVNWMSPGQRVLKFRGTIGEIKRSGGAFEAELRGLTEALNQPRGRVYQRTCAAILGDARCGVDLSAPQYSSEVEVMSVAEGRVILVRNMTHFSEGWFVAGRITVLSGDATGVIGAVRRDVETEAGRRIELWQSLRAPLRAGDRALLEAGCAKTMGMCRSKFDNILNFRGFPDIPGEDWLKSYPSRASGRSGGSRR